MLSNTIQNERLKKKVEDYLNRDNRLKESEIQVRVAKGEVTLSGTVSSHIDRRAASIGALNIPEVAAVNNQLSVQHSDTVIFPKKDDDQAIAHNIAEALERNPIIDANMIDVKVDHGTVSLSGTLPTWNAILAANETALHTCGVVAVIDALTKRQHD